ncbi:hypothetical protein L208DRAFT_1379629 [Tricholoma matsutake]|nr:hypothetical protein L208DRAFT_1379629 [Tricholoma matsutake 945]
MPTIKDCVLKTLKTVASLSLDIDAEARSWFHPVPAIIPDDFFGFLQERAMGIAFGAPKPILLSTLVPAASVLAAGQSSLDALQMSNAWQQMGVQPNLLTQPFTPPPMPTIPGPSTHPFQNNEMDNEGKTLSVTPALPGPLSSSPSPYPIPICSPYPLPHQMDNEGKSLSVTPPLPGPLSSSPSLCPIPICSPSPLPHQMDNEGKSLSVTPTLPGPLSSSPSFCPIPICSPSPSPHPSHSTEMDNEGKTLLLTPTLPGPLSNSPSPCPIPICSPSPLPHPSHSAEMDDKGNIDPLPLDLKENGSPSPPTTPIQGALGLAPAASPSRHDMDMDIDIPGVQHSPQHSDMELDSEENDILEEVNTIPSDDNDEYGLAKDLADVFNEVIRMNASQEETGSDRGDSEVASPRPSWPRKNKPRRKEDNGDKPYNPGATASQFKNLTETLPSNEITDGKEHIVQNSKNEVIDLTLEEVSGKRSRWEQHGTHLIIPYKTTAANPAVPSWQESEEFY